MGRKYQGPTLYWRILANGKYTWKKAVVFDDPLATRVIVDRLEESE